MKPENLKEFKALIKRYESITLEEINECKHLNCAALDLTGFGDSDDCTLCKNIDWWNDCSACIYYILTGFACNNDHNKKTYLRILNADTPKKLFDAFQARAKHMKTLIS